MKNKLICILMTLLIIIYGHKSYAQEPEFVYEFEEFPAEILLNNKYYNGILLSETEYGLYTNLKIGYNSLSEKYKIVTEYNQKFEKIFEDQKQRDENILEKLLSIKKESQKTDFWSEYGFEIGLTTGVVLTIIIFFTAKEISNGS